MSNQKSLHLVILDFDDLKNPLLAAGQAHSTYEVGKRLAQKGHRITVYCSRYPGSYDRTQDGITYHHIGVGTNHIRFNNLIYILAVPWVLRTVKADLILECFTAPVSTLFSPVFTSIPVVAKPTSFDARRFWCKYHLPFHWIEQYGLRFYRYFMPYNNYCEQKMRRVNPKIVTQQITEGVPDSYFKIETNKPQHLLYLSRLDVYQKGLDLLLQAYAKIAANISYPLIIAGGGPDEAVVRSLITKLKLNQKVFLVGPAYGEEKKQLMSAAKCVILPSRQEGFGIFALETLAVGIPLITFNIPGLSWIDPQNAIKVPAFNTAALAKAMLNTSQIQTTTTQREKVKNFARQYTWDQIAHHYESFFFDVLKRELAKR